MPDAVPTHAALSQLLVALTIEIDNEAEQRFPHRTTNHGSSASPRAPWLVSFPLWVHCLRYVPDSGVAGAELVERSRLTSRSMATIVKRMSRWWGYLRVDGNRVVHLTDGGLLARRAWTPLPEEIERRWDGRFGAAPVKALRDSLALIVEQFELDMPDYLPLGEARLRRRPQAAVHDDAPLSTLLSKLLLAFALDFDGVSTLELSQYTAAQGARLGIAANLLRVLERPTPLATLPELTGVAPVTLENWVGALAKHGFATVAPGPNRRRIVDPSERGDAARVEYEVWVERVEDRFATRFGAATWSALRDALSPFSEARLLDGIEPHPDGWRAQVRRATALPHQPLVTARGGFPDGS